MPLRSLGWSRGEPLSPSRCEEGLADDRQLLTHYRRQLIKERTLVSNRAHVDLTILRPGYQRDVPQLTRPVHLAAARKLLRGLSGVRVEITRARLDRLRQLDTEIKNLASRISAMVLAAGTNLLDIRGVGPLTAGRIMGETRDVRRFRERNAFATANGTAPIPVRSGRTDKYRLNRAGNRRLNEAIHTIALVQSRAACEGRTFLDRKKASGKTGREAVLSLKRRLSDVVFTALLADLRDQVGLYADPAVT